MKQHRRPVIALLTCCILFGLSGWASGLFVPEETTVVEVAPGVFFRKTALKPKFLGCNNGWVIFKDFVLVIEANFPKQSEEVIKEIRKTTDKPIKYVFDTHYHGDHADGNMVFQKLGATGIANENSQELFDTKGINGFEDTKKKNPKEFGHEGLEYGKPTLYFPRKLVLDDGTQRVELIHYGHAHTAGDAMAWLPKHGILFTGDACVNGPFNYTGDSDTESWVAVLTELDKLPVKMVLPGHGESSDKSLLATQRRYFVELRQYIQMAIDKGRTLEQIKQEIVLPFYKEWTGIDVKENVENIEFVYKKLKK
jgi:cyclase